jgi:hypothetical protein
MFQAGTFFAGVGIGGLAWPLLGVSLLIVVKY